MKRFLTLIVAICAFFAASAQHPMVTLSHNGELSFFSNLTAFNSAVEAAEDGDILYLSEGEFILENENCKIDKHIMVVGSGYNSHIIGDVLVDMSHNENSVQSIPLFDGLTLEKLTFTAGGTSANNLGQNEIRRCHIKNLIYGDHAGKEVTYMQCYINKFSQYGGTNTVVLQNSKIDILDGQVNSIINCNVANSKIFPKYTISSILNVDSNCFVNGSATIINSLLRSDPSQKTNMTTENCYIVPSDTLLDENLNSTVDLSGNGYLGQDGTVVGIYGGESPFSENPSVPTVDSAKSSVEYDAANNKLKVSITVKAD